MPEDAAQTGARSSIAELRLFLSLYYNKVSMPKPKPRVQAAKKPRVPAKPKPRVPAKPTPKPRALAKPTSTPKLRAPAPTVPMMSFHGADPATVGALSRTAGQLYGKHDVVVLVYSRDCGHCANMRPAWDSFARQAAKAGILTMQVEDTTIDRLPPGVAPLADLVRQDMSGVPHVVAVTSGMQLALYEGSRSSEDLFGFAVGMKNNQHSNRSL